VGAATRALHAHPAGGELPEDGIDACDVDFRKGDLTRDEDLPPAAGGVVVLHGGTAFEDDVDACDVDFTQGELTPDDGLPPSAGGVAT
jgi:hypothetical protein